MVVWKEGWYIRKISMDMCAYWYHLSTRCHVSRRTSFGRPHQDLTILHSKVCGHWLLTTLTSRGLFLVSCLAKEETNLQYTTDGLDFGGQRRDIVYTIFTRAVFAGFDVVGSEQWLEWSVDDVKSLIGLNWTGLDKGVLSKDWVYGSKEFQLSQYRRVTDRCNLDRNTWPCGDQTFLVLAVVLKALVTVIKWNMIVRPTCNANEALRSRRNQLLLEQTCTSTLDAVQLIVDLVSTVKSNIQHDILWQRVESNWYQSRSFNDLSRLETCWDKVDVVTGHDWVLLEIFRDSFNTIFDCASRTNTDVAKGRFEMVLDGLERRLALGRLDELDVFSHCAFL